MKMMSGGSKLCFHRRLASPRLAFREGDHTIRGRGGGAIDTATQHHIFKSLQLRPPTPEAYGKTADFGTLCIRGSSQRLDPSAALLSSSDRSRLAALNVMLTPCPVP